MEVIFSGQFKKEYKKRIKDDKEKSKKFFKRLELFINDPFNPSLQTHKLTGILKNMWAFKVDYDLRVVFYFENDEKAIFINIGTHNQVY
ncbi:MAG: type II toxin-antitoxin system mRNA interferase toxin, RelE/StbE family [Ignavibacteria bacterium]|nr:type II toxin-antitoxin system mRNA interferase toxin, RelE/StbE family [Ignavibacteria bacterium]